MNPLMEVIGTFEVMKGVIQNLFFEMDFIGGVRNNVDAFYFLRVADLN